MELVSQQISSLPALPNVDRDVVITGIYVDFTKASMGNLSLVF